MLDLRKTGGVLQTECFCPSSCDLEVRGERSWQTPQSSNHSFWLWLKMVHMNHPDDCEWPWPWKSVPSILLIDAPFHHVTLRLHHNFGKDLTTFVVSTPDMDHNETYSEWMTLTFILGSYLVLLLINTLAYMWWHFSAILMVANKTFFSSCLGFRKRIQNRAGACSTQRSSCSI